MIESIKQIKARLLAENWYPGEGPYKAGQRCNLRVHPVTHVDGRIHFHYCVPSEMDSANTGSQEFILTEDEANSLNRYGQL